MKRINKLKRWYFIFWECGLIVALLAVIAAFSLHTERPKPDGPEKPGRKKFTPLTIPRTVHTVKPAAPLSPEVTAEKPKDNVIEDLPDISDIQLTTLHNREISPLVQSNRAEETIFIAVEQMPRILGGVQSIYKNIDYPQKARMQGIEGTVRVQFIVDAEGNVQQAKVVKGIGGGCDEEALEVVKKLRFKPGKQRGRAVKVRMSLPVVFRLKN